MVPMNTAQMATNSLLSEIHCVRPLSFSVSLWSAMARTAKNSKAGRSGPVDGVHFNLAPSFRLDIRCLDDRPPLLDLGLVKGSECLRRLLLARRNLLAQIGEPLANGRIGQGFDNRAIERGDDVLGVPFGAQSPCQTET